MERSALSVPTAPDPAREALRLRLAAHMLRVLPAPGDHAAAVPGLSLYRRDGYCPPASMLYEPSLALVVQGRKRVLLGTEAYEYDAGRFMLTSLDLPTIAHVLDGSAAAPFLAIVLRLDPETVTAVAAEIDLAGAPGAPAVPSGPAMTIGTVTAPLLDAVVRLAALDDTPGDVPVMGRLVLREIAYRLLTGPAGGRLRQLMAPGSRCERIGRAVAFLRRHFAEPVRIEALAAMAGMGVSTFHHQFSAITGMSPLQYQKRIRLHEARRLMLADALDAGAAAFRVGYESATQFSREYRRLFGAPPMRDIAQLRGMPAVATAAA